MRWGHAGQTVAGVTVREAPSNHLGTTTVVVQHFKATERERTERNGDRVGGKYHGYCNRWLSNKTVASVEWGVREGGNNIGGEDPNCHKDTTLMDGCHATIVINGIKQFVSKGVFCRQICFMCKFFELKR